MKQSVFAVPKMDCASEERMIRTALDGVAGVKGIECDLAERMVRVVHDGEPNDIEARLAPLGLGTSLVRTTEANASEIPVPLDSVRERRTLWILFAVNATMFVVGVVAAWIAHSTGLLADSLDMFADAAVFGLALYAIGRNKALQLRVAHAAGGLQLVLAVGALVQVVRRAIEGGAPEAPVMMTVAAVSLVANTFCLWLMTKHRDGGAHMKASTVFLANDVLANLGVIAAGIVVALTGSPYPDLLIGSIIAMVVLLGARRILRLR